MKFLTTIVPAAALTVASPAFAAQEAPFGLFGIKIGVADFERSAKFYEALGMKRGPRHNPARWELQWTSPARGSSIMMALKQTGSSNDDQKHASLMVYVPDVAAAAGRLKALGYGGIGEPKVMPRSTILIIRDPDGNEVELLGPGSRAQE